MRLILAVAAAAALTGCGPSGPDFTEQADLPAALLIDEFAAVASLSSPLSEAGYGGSRVKLERRGDSALLFTVPSTESKQGSTFLLEFTPGEKPLHSSLSVTIDVPPIPMGLNKVLSEDKVEHYFRRYARQLIDAAASRESTGPAGHELVSMFDALTLATNPSLRRKLASDAQAIDLGEGDSDSGEPSDEEINRSLFNSPEMRDNDAPLGTDPQGTEPEPNEPAGSDPDAQ